MANKSMRYLVRIHTRTPSRTTFQPDPKSLRKRPTLEPSILSNESNTCRNNQERGQAGRSVGIQRIGLVK